MNKQKEYLQNLKQGCNKPIYIGSLDGYAPYDIGWKCGEKTREGIILYCKPCWSLMEKMESKLEKQIKGDDGE